MPDVTQLFKIYANFRLNKVKSFNPIQVQENQLLKLLSKARNTQFGREHNFAELRSVSDFQKNVPLRTYDDFWNQYWKVNFPIIENITWPEKYTFFAVSSGTSTGTTKYLPISQQMLKSNTKAGLDVLCWHIANKPTSKIFSGKNFMLGGSTNLVREADGVFSGDLSGLTVKEIPWWIKPWYFPPKDLALISDWEDKIDKIGKASLSERITMLGGVPSWMLIFIDKLAKEVSNFDGKLNSIYPNLELLIHGGVNFAPYYDQFRQLLDNTNIDLREVYPASEGFIALADREYQQGMRLMLDNEIFFEFVPLEELTSNNPTRHWVANLELDVNYAVIMTTCSGLWSYVIGDTVKFVDKKTPRLLVSGRTSYYLSAFGEHLIDEEIEDGITTAARKINTSVTDYSVGALFPKSPSELGGHLYIIEFNTPIPNTQDLEIFINELDSKLSIRNEDYQAHRADGFGLNPPKVIAVKNGFFALWMKKRGKLGGQNKVPRIITNTELFDDLRNFAEQHKD